MPIDTANMHALFIAAEPELRAMQGEVLVQQRIPRERAVQLTTVLRREFAPLLPRLGEELSKARAAERKADFEALEPNAMIFYAADLAVEAPWTSAQKARRAELVRLVHEHDAVLAGWAVPLFRKQQELIAVVKDILRGRGIRDDADDTIRWVGLFRGQWARVKGKTPITIEQLDAAERDATELLRLLDAAEDDRPGSPRDLRRRAYTRWFRTYSEIFHLGRYLLRHDPVAAARFPGIATERTLSDSADDDDAGDDTTPPVEPQPGPTP